MYYETRVTDVMTGLGATTNVYVEDIARLAPFVAVSITVIVLPEFAA